MSNKCGKMMLRGIEAWETEQGILGYSPNFINVCVDQYLDSQIKGRCYHQYSEEPILFNSLNQLFLALENQMDAIDFPKRRLNEYDFSEQEDVIPEKSIDKVNPLRNMPGDIGKIGTFVMNILYRQNATWQGKVIWVEKKKSCCFRSALELMKVIDEALALSVK